MNQRIVLRSLVVAEFLFTLADIFVARYEHGQFSGQVRQIHTDLILNFYGPFIKPLLIWGILLATLKALSGIGIFFFWKPAKTVYIISTIFVIICNTVLTPGIETLWQDIFGTLSLCVGVWIIAMLRYSEIKKEFL